MKKKTTTKATKKPVQYEYSLPEYGVSVKASDVDEAIKKAKKVIKERKNG
jgi:hypothetical protein